MKISRIGCSLLLVLGAHSAKADDALDALIKKYGNKAAEKRAPAATTSAKPTRPKKIAPAKVQAPVVAAPAPTNVPLAPVVAAPAPTVVPVAPTVAAPPAEAMVPAAPLVPAVTAAPVAPEVVAVKEEEPEETLFSESFLGRKSLKEKGIELYLKYKGDLVQNFSGGLDKKTVFMGNVDLIIESDLEKLFNFKGSKIVLYGLGNHGPDATEFVGDSFATSNIEAPNRFKVYEFYLNQELDQGLSLIFGARDLNADFYALLSSGNLINSAFGIGPAFSQNAPSIFPQAAMALYFKYQGPTSVYFQSGVFNANSGDAKTSNGPEFRTTYNEGYIQLLETGYADDEGEKPYKYSLGYWHYSLQKEGLDPADGMFGNHGFYAMADQALTSNLSVFLRYGFAEPKVNKFDVSTEVGFAFKGLLGSRPNDVLSIGRAFAHASDRYQELNDSEAEETVYELSYLINCGSGVELTPDYQYIVNPGLSKTVKDAQVAGLRIKLSF